jgi:hypothetical protein
LLVIRRYFWGVTRAPHEQTMLRVAHSMRSSRPHTVHET